MNLSKIIPFFVALSLSLQGQEIGGADVASLSTQIRWENEKPLVEFSWKIEKASRCQLQKSYRILLDKKTDNLKADAEVFWDSKEVKSFQSLFVKYDGPELEAGVSYHWKVQLTNSEETAGSWSEPTSFMIPEEGKQPGPESASGAKSLGNFECSDTALNELFQDAIESRERSLTVPPAFKPKEEMWAAPMQLSARGYAFQADLTDYYSPWIEQFIAEAGEDKTFPAIVNSPEHTDSSPGHSDAPLVIPYALWQLNGDRSLVEEVFLPAVDHVGVMQKNDPDFTGKAFGKDFGDFGNQNDPTSAEFLSLCSFALDCRILSEMATAIGHLPYIMQHNEWFRRASKGFQKAFLDENGQLTEKSQTAQILALRLGLLPQDLKQPTADALATRLEKEGLTAGIFGTAAVLPVLSWTGHHDQAVALAKSFGEEDANPSDVALATTSEWMMSFLAGFIHEAPGFKTSRISPFIPDDGSITEVKAHYETPYGKLAIHWKTTEKGLTAEVTIPPNTTGLISLPGDEKATLSESGKSLEEAIGCQVMQHLGGRHEIIAQSGTYKFEVNNP